MIAKNIFISNKDHTFEISQDEIPLFLDIIPFPSIIINSKNRTILTINGLVTELTNFGRQELVGLEIISLLEQFPAEKIIENRKYEGSIKIKGKSELPVFFELRFLSQTQNIAIIKITRRDIGGGKHVSSEKKIIESLDRINQEVFAGNESVLYAKILSEILVLFNFSKACIYLFEDQEKILRIIDKGDDLFPQQLPGIEMERIKKIDYWSPGKRVLTEVHRIGRKNGCSFVITVPLGSAQIGLLIIVSEYGTINTKEQREFELYIGWMNHFLDQINLLNKNNEEKNRLINNNLILSIFFEQSNDCFVLINGQNKITAINEQLQKLLKYSSYELIGQNFLDFIQAEKIRKIIEEENIDPIVEISPVFIHDRDGNKIPVKMKIIGSELAELENKLIIFSNISAQIDTEKTIEKIGNQAALGEVIADFAHEVRNPINNISTGLQLMRKKMEGEESSLEIIDRLQSDCVRMNDLMESILSFSRQDILNFKPFNCKELLERINIRFGNKYKKSKITSRLLINSDKTMVFGDIRSIDQIFTNLINNSVDAMEQTGGELTIKIEDNIEYPNYLEIIISDTGRGIPDELKAKIFDPFITGKEKGTGLGLAITKRIVEAHEGRITVDSFANGTIFTMLLKLVEEE